MNPHTERTKAKVNVTSLSVYLPPANEVCEGYIFTGVCLSTGGACTARGACVVGMCVAGGACVAGGHAWSGVRDWWGGLCGWGGVHGWGRAWYARPPPHTMRYGRSMRGRYASYWNALCFALVFAFPWVIRKFYGIKTTRNSAQIVQLSLLFSDLVNRFEAQPNCVFQLLLSYSELLMSHFSDRR